MKGVITIAFLCCFGTSMAQQMITQQTAKEPTAKELYEKAFDYLRGENGEIINMQKAHELFLKSAKMGYAPAQCESAFIEKNDEIALKWLLKAVEQNYSLAFWHISKIYHQGGQNIPIDQQKSNYYLEKGAELGNATCQWILGYNHHYGEDGYSVNINQAIYWLEKAANQNQDDAMEELGELYQDGELVKRDIEKTIYWYQKASELKNKIAIERLATMYQYGDGVDVNKEKAFKLMKEAASLGGSTAQIKTGIMYDEGIGCEKDRYAAEYWWGIALKNPKTAQEDKEILKRWLDE